MRISRALKQLPKKGTMSSKQICMYKQKRKDLLYWLLECNFSTDEQAIIQYMKMLRANDWEIDNED